MYKKNFKPEFSIVIPIYKRNDLAAQAVKSVLNQKEINKDKIEIIISDDEEDFHIRSKNKIYFSKFSPQIIYTKNKHKEGPGGNRQTGFDLVRGKYVVFLDSDDRLMPDFLVRMGSYIKKNKSAAVVCFSKTTYGKRFGFRERCKLLLLTTIRDMAHWSSYLFNHKCIYPPSFYLCQFSHMIFNEKIIKGQKFNYEYRHGGEDWDFFVQTLKKGKIAILPERLLLFRYTQESSTFDPKNKLNKWNSYLLLIKRLQPRFKNGIFYYLLLRYIHLFGGKLQEKYKNNQKRWDLRAKDTITGTKLWLANFSIIIRTNQYEIFKNKLKPKISSGILDVGVTSDETIKDSNLFEKIYPFQNNLTVATIEDAKKIKRVYPKLKKVILIRAHKKLPFKDKEFDIAVSWATLEHVGDYGDQEFFINELLRISKNIFLTTPYRGCIYEPHTGLPFVQWLPLSIFRNICNNTGRKFWATFDTLNPLWVSDIKNMKLSRKINVQVYKTFGFLPSHMIITT